ncbi:MAG TPA: beta-1,4-galactosyltransferase [Candidatus Hydrogenedentes bacterium]|nr:beta-1,4-galactosyltransferase [Candidatus Hydrogenedentota bacterium]HIJ72579.1 beta-1,4-galactosyltransferase [Candidatus Hydrogenedentota bacterium]
MIYVTVGTLFLDFPRLIHKMDAIADATGEEILIQTGLCTTLPKHCGHFDFKPHDECLAMQREARVVVCHAGIGSILDALSVRRPLLVVPRLKRHNEHLTDHQLDIADAVQRRGWGRAILDVDDLDHACANPPAVPEAYTPAKHRLIIAIRDAIDRVAAGNPAR